MIYLLLSLALSSQSSALITIQKGDCGLIISAPHGGRMAIEGVAERVGGGKIRQFTKVRDTDTDLLALAIAKEVENTTGKKPWVVAANFSRKFIDANRPAEDAYESPAAKPVYDAYHQALKEACETSKRLYGNGLLLDIHGQGKDRTTNFRGTRNWGTVPFLLKGPGKAALVGPDGWLRLLVSRGFAMTPSVDSDDKETPEFNGGYIVGNYRKTVDALQFETGADSRGKDSINKTAKAFAETLVQWDQKFHWIGLAPDKG